MHDIAAERCGLLFTYTYSNLLRVFLMTHTRRV